MFALSLSVAWLVACFHGNYAYDPLTRDDLIPPADFGRVYDEGGPQTGVVLTTVDLEGAGSNSPKPSEPMLEGDINMRGKTVFDYAPHNDQDGDLDHGGGDGLSKQFNAQLSAKFRWPGGILPYLLQWERTTNQNRERRYRIALAFKEIADKTCIQFVPKEDHHSNYVRLANVDEACWSSVGRMGGQQNISLTDACLMKHGTIIHEIMHALGFFHEQSRADRDSYVKIFPANIMDGREGNFKSYDLNKITHLGMPYDYGSVLHYPPLAFSKNGEPTILPIPNDNVEIGQRRSLSEIDAKKINKLYNCPPKDTGQVDQTTPTSTLTTTLTTSTLSTPNQWTTGIFPTWTTSLERSTTQPRTSGGFHIPKKWPPIVGPTTGTSSPYEQRPTQESRVYRLPMTIGGQRIVTQNPGTPGYPTIGRQRVVQGDGIPGYAAIVTQTPEILGFPQSMADFQPTPRYGGRDSAMDSKRRPVVTASNPRSGSNQGYAYSCARNKRCRRPDRVPQDRMCTVSRNRKCAHTCSTSAFCKRLARRGQCTLMTKRQEMRTFCGCACQEELAST